ncbi:hypothetical protein RB3226 [Rhodopirellula baltica SH 1]|uniref:Uncharacterized protein n=1 Tax=Rhodopirellula baltica (strain DSM 10527 / NCIMB 13988 / SH1) TaxID=243090 RepID=Q7UUL4_RHOBA|nr:hypothetical protein RB3226 [Rhodopirellula baltica SH 1]
MKQRYLPPISHDLRGLDAIQIKTNTRIAALLTFVTNPRCVAAWMAA